MSTEEQKVEMEAVPLKSDTDTPTDAPAEPVVEEKSVKKTWFFSKKTKKVDEPAAEASGEETKTTEEKPKCAKKCGWWNRSDKTKSETEQKADHISIGINLVDRDEKNLNDHVRFGFEDIFGEADTQHSWDCAWRLTFKIFTWTRLFIYRLCALFIGIPAAVIFGLFFGVISVLNVFVCVPFAKLLTIPANWIAKTWNFIVHAIVDPVASAFGLLFSSFTIRKYGINSQPTDPCVA